MKFKIYKWKKLKLIKSAIRFVLRRIDFVTRRFGRSIQIVRLIRPNEFYKLLDLITANQRRVPLIRIGGNGDGGYLVPDILDSITACFSPGVGNSVRFELNLVEKGIKCFLADGSIDRLPENARNLFFLKKFLGIWSTDQITTLEEWIDDCFPGSSNLLLQMDIEGGEFEIILSSKPELLRKFKIMVIEFHLLNQVLNVEGFGKFYATLSQILQDFYIVHIHPNNAGECIAVGDTFLYSTLEITFLRKDLFQGTIQSLLIPHPLDEQNVKHHPVITLDKMWIA